MATREECRKWARECVEAAQTLKSPGKERMLHLAEKWLVLADQVDEVAEFQHGGTTQTWY